MGIITAPEMPEQPKNGFKFKPFEESDIRSLKLFHERIEDIKKSRIIRTSSLRASIQFSSEGMITDFPDNDDLRSLMFLIRPFLLQNESVSFKNIFSIFKKYAADDETKSYFKKTSKFIQWRSRNAGLTSHINGEEYKDKDFLRLSLYGDGIHIKDPERSKLECINGADYMIISGSVRALGDYLNICLFLDWFIIKYVNQP